MLLRLLTMQLPLAGAAASVPTTGSLPADVVPLPASADIHGTAIALAEGFRFVADPASPSLPALTAALDRFNHLLPPTDGNTNSSEAAPPLLAGCSVHVSSASLELSLQTDESYTLTIDPNSCKVAAPTVFGAMCRLSHRRQRNPSDRSFVLIVALESATGHDRHGLAAQVRDGDFRAISAAC
jgi:hypothetical protein